MLEVGASCMRDEAYNSDILVAGGGNDPTSGPLVPVALDSGCVDRGTSSIIPGGGLTVGAPADATGVEPGVGDPATLWSLPHYSKSWSTIH